MWKPYRMMIFFQKSIFLIKIHVRQYLNKMGEFLKVMAFKYSLSRQLTDYERPKGTGNGTTCLN